MPNLVIVDGMPVDAANPQAAETAIVNLRTARDTALNAVTDGQTALAAANTTIAARDAEIVTLKDAVTAAKLSPQALRDAAASYSRTMAKAKALGATVTDAMDEAAVQAAVVTHKMGDAAKGYTAEQNAAAFAALTAGVADAPGDLQPVTDGLRTVIGDGPVSLGDQAKQFADARNARFARFGTAHTGAVKQEG